MASGRRLQSSQIPSSQISPRQSVSLIREDLTGVPLDAIALIIENRFGIPFVLPPSPNTHPLQNKPQARNEQVHGPLASGKTSTRSSAKDSVLAVARQKATLFNVSSTPNQILRSGSRLSTDSCASIATPALAYRKGLREREGKAIEVAAEVGDVQEWGYYLKYYSEGRFNLSRPPDPPPRKPDFLYFQAPAVPDELSRIKAFKLLNVAYPEWALKHARLLVVQAMRFFKTSRASISFFDRRNEVMKAESGYNRAVIPRTESIGAHCLFSMEAMVILDTRNDWRLQYNPLVTGPPYIRFYAAAPILTPEGHVIGAFAIFDPQPKEHFDVRERQRLVEFAQAAMADIEMLAEDAKTGRQRQNSVSTTLRPSIDEDDVSTARSRFSRTGENGGKGLRRELSVKISGIAEEVESNHRKMGGQKDTNVDFERKYQQEPSRIAVPAISRSTPDTHNVSFAISPTSQESNLPTPPNTPSVQGNTPSRASQPSKEAPNTSEPASATSAQEAANQTADAKAVLAAPEARYLITLMAQTLGWDFVYVLRVHEAPLVDESPSIDGGSTELVLAHGLPSPAPIFSHSLHLRALRSAGGLIYRDDGATEKVGYKVGIMLPMVRVRKVLEPSVLSLPGSSVPSSARTSHMSTTSLDQPSASTPRRISSHTRLEMMKEDDVCESGIVLGAFLRETPFQAYEPRHEDIVLLRGAGMKLMGALFGPMVTLEEENGGEGGYI